MPYQTFKVCILIDNNVENFYIKPYIDQNVPVFNRFKNQVFTRNPSVNSPNLKIYWIDAENDQILIACEEDFTLFLEEGKGRKIFFSVTNNAQQNNEQQEEESIPMEAEIVETQNERRGKKGHKDDEKRCRRVEKLSKKLRHYEDACKNEEERSRCRHSEKRDIKNNERLEKAKRRVEQIRTIISSIDPANLNSSNANAENNAGTSTSSNEATPPVDLPFSPETVRLLSSAIANCLQPCNLINKVLNEVYAIIPQVMEHSNDIASNIDQQDQQQQTEIPKNTTATNTSNANTPLLGRNSNQEIEELFKEAAKELEKMNEIVNNNKMESSSTSSNFTGITQIERVFKNINDSALSDATIVDMNSTQNSTDQLDSSMPEKSMDEEYFKIVTPPKSMRSRESSIEIHDVSSVMSDDSRDWTILSQDELSMEPVQRNVNPETGAVPKHSNVDQASAQIDEEIQTNEDKNVSIKSISIETQTPTSLLSGGFNQQQLQASVQKSIDIVQKSIESIHKSMETSTPQKPENINAQVEAPVSIEQPKSVTEKEAPASIEQPKVVPEINSNANMRRDIYPNLQPTAPLIPETSQANLNAARFSQINNKKPQQKFEPAVVVYDPNPKINSSVHTMMNMGFSNEDNWLTQLLINVDGDIAKALNFLTPQPKNRKP